jgi:pyruvate formate lyase activating enzyme
VLQEARALGLHTALQTAGHVSWRALESLLHHTDLVMYDLKHALAPRHQALTGAGNRTILDNLERLAGLAGMEPCRNGAGAHRPPAHQAVKFIVRIPVVPGCNDAPDEMAGLAGLLADLPSSPERVELLPYHNLGVPKYQGLGRTYALPEVRPPSSTAALAGLAGLFSSYGLRAVVEGAGFDEP